MNTYALSVHDVFTCARALVLAGAIVQLSACNSVPSQSNSAEVVYADPVANSTSVGAVAVAPNNNAQPMPVEYEFNVAAPDADEVAAIQRITPGAEPRAAIKNYLATLLSDPEHPVRSSARVLFIGEAGYQHIFPGRLFYVVRFPQWPVAVEPPQPLAANNLFVFESGKPLQLITNGQQLQKYFSQAAVMRGGEDVVKQVLEAWLTLYSEFSQDGMFQFGVPQVENVTKTTSNALEAKGRVIVVPKSGDSGEISARIAVDANGRLLSVHTEQSLRAGVRPICQATKLLDPDPLVRRMAERDLLVMGTSARDYLLQQRSKASPELRARIDRLWQQVLKEGR